MKKYTLLTLVLLFLFSLQSCMVSQKPKMEFFDNARNHYKEAKFTSINVPMFLAKPFVKKSLREEGENEEVINIITKVSDIKVLTVENGNQAMIADYAKYLTKNNFEEWMTIKKKDKIIKFQAKQKGEQIRNLLISISSGTKMVFVDVTGKFTADDISRIINLSEKKDLEKIVSK